MRRRPSTACGAVAVTAAPVSRRAGPSSAAVPGRRLGGGRHVAPGAQASPDVLRRRAGRLPGDPRGWFGGFGWSLPLHVPGAAGAAGPVRLVNVHEDHEHVLRADGQLVPGERRDPDVERLLLSGAAMAEGDLRDGRRRRTRTLDGREGAAGQGPVAGLPKGPVGKAREVGEDGLVTAGARRNAGEGRGRAPCREGGWAPQARAERRAGSLDDPGAADRPRAIRLRTVATAPAPDPCVVAPVAGVERREGLAQRAEAGGTGRSSGCSSLARGVCGTVQACPRRDEGRPRRGVAHVPGAGRREALPQGAEAGEPAGLPDRLAVARPGPVREGGDAPSSGRGRSAKAGGAGRRRGTAGGVAATRGGRRDGPAFRRPVARPRPGRGRGGAP